MTTAAAHQVHFDATNHEYFVDGVRKPSVTEVLQDVGIIDYSRMPMGTRTMALERGRFVHQACEFDDQGDLGEFDERMAGYVAAWRRFRETHGFRARLIEHRGYCLTYGYCGTLDREGVLALGDSEVLLDIKTSVAPYWTAYQTAAYANFFEHPAKYRRMAVALHDDSTFKVHEYRCTDFSKHLNVFLAALTVFNSKER